MFKILINEVIQRDQTSDYLCLPSAIANPQDQRNTPHTPLLLVYIMRHSPGCLELPILGLQPTKTTMPGIIFNDSVQSLARLSGVMQSLARSLPTRDNHWCLITGVLSGTPCWRTEEGIRNEAWGYSSVMQHLSGVHEAPGSLLSTGEKKIREISLKWRGHWGSGTEGDGMQDQGTASQANRWKEGLGDIKGKNRPCLLSTQWCLATHVQVPETRKACVKHKSRLGAHKSSLYLRGFQNTGFSEFRYPFTRLSKGPFAPPNLLYSPASCWSYPISFQHHLPQSVCFSYTQLYLTASSFVPAFRLPTWAAWTRDVPSQPGVVPWGSWFGLS